MRNFVQPGDSITVPAPAATLSGQGVLIGALFGIAATNAATGEDVALSTRGVFELPKEPTTDAFAIGDAVEWDGDNARIAPLEAGERIGVVISAAGATVPTVMVRIG